MNVCPIISFFFVGLTDEGTVRDWSLTTTVVTQSLGASFAKREARSTNFHLLIFSDIFSGIGGIPSATMIDEVVGGIWPCSIPVGWSVCCCI